tara:strand:+ start:1748 stop:2716 length:969 start_codon:yes stop_codon:yes gene_type:complete
VTILVTGCAGFIGYHTCVKLLKKNKIVYGIDNLNKYYDVRLKKNRIKELKKIYKNFYFNKGDIENINFLKKIFKEKKIRKIIHLAAQAGVRYSILKPRTYMQSNILGFFNILECSRIYKVNHCVFASTSSVYGNTKKFPTSENDNTDQPLSFYAATKKSNEVMAYSYSNIYKVPLTGLRFFTVYGPLGRPDMALFKFTKSIINNSKISVYNKGNHLRDFTYIDDVVESIYKLIYKPPKLKIPFEIYNVSSNNPITLNNFISKIEKQLNKKSKVLKMSIQKGDVIKTHGNNKKITKKTKYKIKNDLDLGINKFTKWYKTYYSK